VFLEERARLGLSTDGDFPVRRELIIANTKAEARRMAAQRSAGRYETYLQWGLGSALDADNSGFGSQEDADIEGRFILGNPETCATELDRLRRELGMTHFMLKTQWPGLPHREAMRQLEWFGTKVIPLLRAEAHAA
jgi:alkanesulfonate monooxygenase SsuD/methylene tetrahydromethanopterin reductase-like flavin-dependent oxidoreductase (luciferase family)